MNFDKFEEKAGVVFKDKSLLKQAFTHRSYINENRDTKPEHNERLEFLGDTVLQSAVTDYVFHNFPEMNEGRLSWLRSALVNANTCSAIAEELNVKKFLLVSKGAMKESPRAQQSILADALEAIIGAIYIDQNYETAKNFILTHVIPLTKDILEKGVWFDAKSLFQENAQANEGITPAYKLISESGPPHDSTFVMGVYLKDELIGRGSGKSKQEAEQEAARAALESKGWK